jgi:dihydroflavonol-4-reductase
VHSLPSETLEYAVKNILVTGATGCIGSNLIIRLLESGYTVRAFRRTTSNLLALSGVDVEHVIGDIRDRSTLAKAMKGCDTVFHTAAMVSFWRRKREEQFDINVSGTRNVVEACLAGGIEKLVHTSSVAALGYRTDGKLIDETTAFNWDQRITYKFTKHLGELEVLDGVARGLNATLVNPTVVIGPRDVYIHGGQIVRDTKRGRIPMYVRGGMNIVSVHDIVSGHIAAAGAGRTGERYILGGSNLTHREVFGLAAKVLGVRPPFLKIPVWAIRSVAKMCDAYGTLTGGQPWITSDLISGIGTFNWYSSEKAGRELQYRISPVEEALRQTFEWYNEHNLL